MRSSRKLLSTTLLVAAVGLPTFVAATAHAQQPVSDADRNTARDLYNTGWQLQQQGKYADALDKYQRSIAVYSAPTTAFRIAQCKAALGQLVEAAEELRAVSNAQLPAGSPEAFVKAKQEAAAELQNIEPRIPKLKINVVPPNAVGLTVTIDGQQMPTALLGVGRAINPGSHRVIVIAPGYEQAQQSVDVREKQQPEITITLKAGGGVSYTANPNNPNPNNPNPNNPNPNNPNPNNGGYGQGGYQGPYGGGQWVPPVRPRGPRTALLVGADVALSVPLGDAPSLAGNLNDELGVGGGIGGEVGLRFARIVYLGAMAQGSFFSNVATGVSFAADGLLGFMSNPDGAGFYGELGGGFRSLGLSNGTTLAGGEFLFGIGIQFKVSNFRFIPKADFFIGPFSDPNNPTASYIHAFFTLGVSGYWELPLEKPQPPPQQQTAPAPAY